DHSYEKNYKYLFNKINKEYTSELLIQEKNEIENSLKFHQLLIIFIIILSFSVGSFIFYRYSKVKKAYKQRFREILAEKNKFSIYEQNSDSSKKTVDRLENHKTLLISKIPGLSPATIDSVLNKLDTFENENQFLNPKITLKSLCEEFNTNSGYLSRIINVYKQKNFTQYINDLRLDYIIEKMKTNKKYLSIEIKELASEAGFGNAESFSDNFQRKFKMKPSIFIKMMKEETKTSFQSHNQASSLENV
ncbi:helix-turn-helix domain-containing protein, partial [Cloacibacterium rupense]